MNNALLSNIAFCNALLSLARKDAKRLGIELPKLTTWKSSFGHRKYYEVYDNETKGVLWCGNASCASEAKSNYINKVIDAQEQI